MFALYFSCLHAFIREWPAHTRVSKNRPKNQDSRGKPVTFTERYCCWDQVKFVWKGWTFVCYNQYDFQYLTNEMKDSFDFSFFFLNLQNLNTFKAREFEESANSNHWSCAPGDGKKLNHVCIDWEKIWEITQRQSKRVHGYAWVIADRSRSKFGYSCSFAKAPKVQESKSLDKQINAVQLSKLSGTLWWKFYIRGKP